MVFDPLRSNPPTTRYDMKDVMVAPASLAGSSGRRRIAVSRFVPALLACLAFAFVSAEAHAQSRYSVTGRTLFDPNGDPIRLVGANVMTQYWDYSNQNVSVPELAKTGANTVRIFWKTTPDGEPTRLRKYLQQAVDNKMIPIVALWDATGLSLYGTEFQAIMAWWTRSDVRALMEEFESRMIINIANEAGTWQDRTEYRTKYREAITTLRNAGYNCPIMLDAPDFGDDYTTMLAEAAGLVSHDPQTDLIFSYHRWRPQTTAQMDQVITAALNANVCFVIGEFGPSDFFGNQTIAWEPLLQRANVNGIGWLSWVWHNPAETINHSMTNNGVYGNWTAWGDDVSILSPESIRKQAVRTPWLTGRTKRTAQAEAGVLNGVTVSTSQSGYSGTGHIDGASFGNGDQITMTVNLPAAGNYNLRIRYAGVFGEKFQNVYVNGTLVGSIRFRASSGWTNVDVPNLSLIQGNNTVRIVGDYGWTHIDRIEVF